ncbi:MAG: ribosome biogenesis GTP-binding protein YihA/YsxC [bacterium]
MKILTAEFVTSADCLKTCPDFKLPEVAMIGRSNVGKSSFINTLVNRKNLARTSNTPGKTRLINFYNLNNQFMITDLPGYGYAKISKAEQNKWKKSLEEYLIEREPLKFVFQLIDARHEIQANDLQMREWLEYYNMPVITVATKCDYLSRNQAAKSAASIGKILHTPVIMFSAKDKTGKEEALNTIEELLFKHSD